jgi:alkanesulfonate monooxygenase SsuD/methylene tetrahydromethanopterin reductase-like flavin-dependent oxidoreductase (luciferase family)
VRPPGYLSLSSAKAVMEAKGGRSGQQTVDSLIASGQLICGSAATVRDQLAEYERTLGLGTFLALQQFGTLPHDLTMASIERFARNVIPALRAPVLAGAG